MRIEPVDRVEELAAWLAGKPGVRQVRRQTIEIVVQLEGNHCERARLLRQIIEAGFDVATFAPTRSVLESVFLSTTRGAVQ
ncbi:MAG: hypothetical protein D6741_07530 [Planctomycetota bacterium]|nr:MAG: hypothetical protein D6741_07530 [Planctomycetota bacterium]